MSAILDFGISTPTMHRKNGGNSFEQPDRSSIGPPSGCSKEFPPSWNGLLPISDRFASFLTWSGRLWVIDWSGPQPRSRGLSLVVFHRHTTRGWSVFLWLPISDRFVSFLTWSGRLWVIDCSMLWGRGLGMKASWKATSGEDETG